MSSSSDTLPRPAARFDAARRDAAAPGAERSAGSRRTVIGVSRFVPALAGWALLSAVAAFQADRAAAPETAFLALWSVAVLLPVAVLARDREGGAALAPVLAVLAVWMLPAGTVRSVALGGLLVAVFAAACGVAWSGWARRSDGERVAMLMAAVLGAQALLRSELLLAPGWMDFASFVGLAALAGLALVRLAVHRGLGPALVAAAIALALGPGWTVDSVLAVIAVAVGAEWVAPRRSALWVAAASALLVAGLVLSTRSAAVALLAGLVVACDGRTGRQNRALPSAVVLVGCLLAIAGAWWAAVRPATEALALLAWLPVLLPLPIWVWAESVWAESVWAGGSRATGRGRARALGWGLAGLVAVAAAFGAPGLVALAAPLAAAAALASGLSARVWWPQWVVSATTAALATLFASYPWLRARPLEDVLALWAPGAADGAPGWQAVWIVAAGAVVAGAAVFTMAAGGRRARWARGALAGLLVAVVVMAIGRHGGREDLLESRSSAVRPIVLTVDRPSFELGGAYGPGGPSRLALVTHVSNGLALADGVPVAEVRWTRAGSDPPGLPLRFGIETDEWAVRRPDVAALRSPAVAVAPWSSRVGTAPDGEPFFGQRYRALLPFPPEGHGVEIVRSADLPDEVVLTIHRIEGLP